MAMGFRRSTAVFARTLLLLFAAQSALSTPLLPAGAAYDHENVLLGRGCLNPCGWADQLCCAADQTCYTDMQDRAQCGGGVTSMGYWQYITSTWVETDAVTRTTVYSTYVGATAAAPVPTIQCDVNSNESPCGTICCNSAQYCQLANHCAPAAPGGTTRNTFGVAPSYSAPLRPTSSTLIVVTASVSATVTVPFETPVATGANITLAAASAESGGGLSGGAIAGIVFGVIFLLLLLILLCLFCCFKAAWDAIFALFGFGGRRHRRETTYIEEHHHHSGASGAAGAAGGRRWYGDRPSRPERPPPRKSGGLGGLGAVAAGLGTLGVALGMKRKYDKRHEKSDHSASGGGSYYYYSSDYTSSSSESSSDRHTRHTRRSSRH